MQQVVVTERQKLIIGSVPNLVEFVDEQGRVLGQFQRCDHLAQKPGDEWNLSEEELARLRAQKGHPHEELMAKIRSRLS